MTRGNSRKRGIRRPRAAAKLTQSPWSQLRLLHGPIELLSIDQIHAIHGAALAILEEVGMRVLDPKARGRLAAAGCTVDEGAMQVRFASICSLPRCIDRIWPTPSGCVT